MEGVGSLPEDCPYRDRNM